MNRIAANPIPYWLAGGKTVPVFEEAFRDFQEIGFTAVKADVPEHMTAPAYARWIAEYGLAPALSLFSSPFDADLPGEIERAKQFAATQTALGLDRTMISSMAVPARLDTPAVGADFDEGRLTRAIDMCGEVCRVLRSEGLRPLHHSHVGGVFETEAEIVRLLDDLGPDVIGFGPDTGHLRWAGVDPAALVRRYADRLGGIHIKDVYADHLAGSALSYQQAQRTKRLWAEPGRGVIDFDAVLAAIPDGYDGDFMIEVDEPSVTSARESHRISYEWAVSGGLSTAARPGGPAAPGERR
ncbi:sugar phosphate isomerase/epimerase family protein [Actinoplanes sp. RD1]|uniref:sugar phosphate isomerase/epimerase family protein n=1 Tax=Actinoplanes sp. RD1 TaxID=3064538 RepID=UPI0027414FE0|nr:sugar phosphate isomerase/epimerase [Actinoplanes sp. RD1]